MSTDPDEPELTQEAVQARERDGIRIQALCGNDGYRDRLESVLGSQAIRGPGASALLDGSTDAEPPEDPIDSDARDGSTDSSPLDEAVDLYVLDSAGLEAYGEAIRRRTEHAAAGQFPLLFIMEGDATRTRRRAIWKLADDVIEAPLDPVELEARVESLVDRQRTAVELRQTRAALSDIEAELRVKERAMDAAPVGMTITDPAKPDNPLVYINESFERLTGYREDEILGQNCRFLQGRDTDPESTRRIREAIVNGEPVAEDVLNYRKDGSTFWNRVEIAPVREDGEIVNCVGFQSDITDRKIHEQRLQVLNRLLTHNLRNHLTVINGYAEILEARVDDETLLESAERIDSTTERLHQLSEGVRRIERSMDGFAADPSQGGGSNTVNVEELVHKTATVLEELAPQASVTVDVEPGEWWTRCDGLSVAIREAAENAITHNDSDEPCLEMRLSAGADGKRMELTFEDNGPGIPAHERAVIEREVETPLQHSDGVGLWLMNWIVRSAGGDVEFGDPGDEGATITFSLPRVRPAERVEESA